MAVNFEYYKIFYYVGKYKNITKAAEALHSNQPNVTRIIKLMEAELGCRLIHRSNKGISLTEEGERLFSHAEIAFEQLQRGEDELAKRARLHGGTIAIGATETALHLCLFQTLRTFREAYPEVRLKIHNYSTPQAVRALQNGRIDFAVVATPVAVLPPLKTIDIISFFDILAGGTAFEDFSKRAHSLADIQDFSIISMEKGTATYDFYNQQFLKHGFVLEPDAEVTSTDLMLPMLTHNLGIGFLPEVLAREALESRRIFQIRLEETFEKRKICLIYDAKRGLSMAAHTLKQQLLAETL